MRETQKKVQPNVDIRAGTAYALPVEDSSVDAVICAQVKLSISLLLTISRFIGLLTHKL